MYYMHGISYQTYFDFCSCETILFHVQNIYKYLSCRYFHFFFVWLLVAVKLLVHFVQIVGANHEQENINKEYIESINKQSAPMEYFNYVRNSQLHFTTLIKSNQIIK